MMTTDRVECRSDHDYIGRPLAFYWQGDRLVVIEVLDQSRTPQAFKFLVRTEDHDKFELNYDTNTGLWSVLKIYS